MRRFLSFLILPAIVFIVLWPHSAGAADLSLEKDLQNSLAQSRTLIEQMDEKISEGQSIQSELERLKSLAEDIRATHLLLQERFRVRADRVSELGPQATDRQNAMLEAYRQTLDEYLQLVDSLTSGAIASPGTMETLKTLLDRVLHKKKRPIFGSLPYGNLNFAAKEPLFEPAITPAYKGGDPDTSAADLQGSPEAPISAEIAALAESLNWNPVSIYEWVKNNIDTEWYWGCMKGAEETLRQLSGNDCDQAALLVALLRAANFPSRYVRGVIEFFPGIDKAKELTGVEDERELLAFFQKAGIPFAPVISAGRVANVRLEHIWVESYIPYANYRGAVIDELGKTWLGLDTSIKAAGYAYNQPEEIPGEVTLAEIRDGYLTAVQSQTPLEYLRGEIENYLSGNTTYDDLLRTRTLRAEEMKILPASLQFEQISLTNEYTEIPSELMHTARFIAADPDNNELFNITLEAFKLSNRAVTISYEPDTVEDQEIINSYGGLDNTPSYLVRLRPVLKVAGERVAIGRDGLPMGAGYTLTVELISPGGTERFTNTHIIGNLSVMGIVSQRAVAPEDIPLEEKDAERLLFLEAVRYVDRWNQAENELGSLLGLSLARPIPTVVTVGGVIEVSYLLDTPHGFQWKGVYVDADLRRVETAGSGQLAAGSQKTFMQLSALQGSVLESRVLEDDFQVDSISTAELFGLANDRGIPILAIDSANIDDLLPTLPFADNIKEDLSSSVNQNYLILIPQAEITYEDWTGIGYLKENPETGEAGYMLSGMIAGGMTVWGLDRWPEYYEDRLLNPFSEPPNYDPASARYIHKITTTDLQKGTVGEGLPVPLLVIVRDAQKKPVAGVEVTFTVKAGGGTFSNGQTVITVTTDGGGTAAADLILGEKTSANPAMWWESTYTYSQQVGENIVDAKLSSGTAIATPFVSYGFPKEPFKMRKTNGDGNRTSILSFAGVVSVVVEDEYGNPISNQPVTFKSDAPSNQTCIGEGEDRLKALLVEPDDPCIKNIPTYEQCPSGTDEIPVKTSPQGAAVQVIMGAVPDADYPIRAASGDLEAFFTLSTYGFGNCDGDSEPSNQLMLKYIYPVDEDGNNINAGKVGTPIPIMAKIVYLRESWQEKDLTIDCSGESKTCTKIVGSKEYYTDTAFQSALVTFAGQGGSAKGGGIYTAMHTLTPGENPITINGSATIGVRKSFVSCAECTIEENYPITLSVSTTMTVYGVDIQLDPLPLIIVDDNGYTTRDYDITYEIEPFDYKAGNAYVVIFKDGVPIAYIPSETTGQGKATISRGFLFEPDGSYEAEVMLNAGFGEPLEIKSKRNPFLFVTVRNADGEKIDEIKFSNDAKSKKRYHLQISGLPKDIPAQDLSGHVRIVDRKEANLINPPGEPGVDYFLAEYPLEFVKDGDNWKIKVQSGSPPAGKEEFILTNLQQSAFEDKLEDITKIYGGLGSNLEIEIGNATMQLPVEPVGIIVLGIDGLRQDVLYPAWMDTVNDGGKYRVSIDELDGIKQILAGYDQADKYKKYIMLPEVTAIFPSITLASWASIFTGKTPNETGITGNEFFARDLYDAETIPGMKGLPSGMITLSDGAFYNSSLEFLMKNLLPAHNYAKSVQDKLAQSSPNQLLQNEAQTVYHWIEEKVTGYESPGSCPDGGECRSAVIFNHYARGADWWGTIDLAWWQELGVSFQTIGEFFRRAFGSPEKASTTLDETPTKEVLDFFEKYYPEDDNGNSSNSPIYNKDKRFPALFTAYYAGLDHYAHAVGLDAGTGNYKSYKDYFQKKTDAEIKILIDKLKEVDEFDNKIFIVVSDHGETAMPSFNEITLPDGRTVEPDNECELKLDDFDEINVQDPEKYNNNLHIWELAEVLRIFYEETGLNFAVLAPEEIARLYEGKDQSGLAGATSNISDANVIVAMNGPMAHVYLRGNNTSWKTMPNIKDLALFASVLKRIFNEDGFFLDENLEIKLRNRFPNLLSSVDKVLMKIDGTYKILGGLDANGDPIPIELTSLNSPEYVRADDRINNLNPPKGSDLPDRSGDIILVMKDLTSSALVNRFTTGVACKAWHGSLNQSDSYVPLILAYPGGNKYEVETIIQDTEGCSVVQGCDGNWNVYDLILEATEKQY